VTLAEGVLNKAVRRGFLVVSSCSRRLREHLLKRRLTNLLIDFIDWFEDRPKTLSAAETYSA